MHADICLDYNWLCVFPFLLHTKPQATDMHHIIWSQQQATTAFVLPRLPSLLPHTHTHSQSAADKAGLCYTRGECSFTHVFLIINLLFLVSLVCVCVFVCLPPCHLFHPQCGDYFGAAVLLAFASCCVTILFLLGVTPAHRHLIVRRVLSLTRVFDYI